MNDTIRGAPPSAEDARALELMDAARRDSLGALERTAEQLIGLDGLISGIYFGAFALGKLPKLDVGARVLFLAPVALWLASLVCAVLVLMPRAYAYNPHEPDEARQVYANLVRTKDTRLKLALWLFVASVAMLMISLWVYLGLIV